jgi:hypothetical protein
MQDGVFLYKPIEVIVLITYYQSDLFCFFDYLSMSAAQQDAIVEVVIENDEGEVL